MKDSQLMESFLKALEFAAYRHRFEKSKNEEPYINHIIKVCTLLSSIGEVSDPEILTAAALHDVLEKTNTKPQEIAALFGEPVSNLVMQLSDVSFFNDQERWKQQMYKAGIMTAKARVIKLADKIANVESILAFPPKGWDIQRRVIYIEWAEKIISVLKGSNPKLENYFEELMQEHRSNYESPELIHVGRVA